MKFSIKDFVSKCDQIRSFLGIWSHLPKKSLMKNFIFCEGYHWKTFALAVTAFITNLCVIVCIKSPFTQSTLQWETSSFFDEPKKSLN